ncbi:AzlC family ABC transporter permease [Acinetobacter pittii]|uniref:AzlC family ABC transporter permease n=1 Tax=Acinetobacter pittii TaxID=48296 RepID=UPI001902694D|nr:AzlC family ABC transporter permease [Acinetobacter pittii]MBJ9935619.1 AzlC family ABC transporter permease [Acinetobacter pittii]
MENRSLYHAMSTYSLIKKLSKDTTRSIFFVCLATSVVGMSLGSLAASYGLALWIPLCLSVFVLAGTAEFIFIGFLAVGGSPIAAAIAGLLVNLRHLPFGIAVSELIRGKFSQYFGSHIMNDESVLFGMAQPDFDTKKAAYWLCGIGIMLSWPLGVTAGYFIGSAIPDPKTFGLDAIFPAILIALTFSALKNKVTRKAAFAGSTLALITTPFLASGLPILISLFGLIFGRKK